MNNDKPKTGNACDRCGSRDLTLVVGRVTRPAGGFVNFFRCKTCGDLSFHEVHAQISKE